MPITRSAKKALRQSVARQIGNFKKNEAIGKFLRDIRKAVVKKDAVAATKLLPGLYTALDKAAKTGVIKKNAAARKKSRMTKLVNSL